MKELIATRELLLDQKQRLAKELKAVAGEIKAVDVKLLAKIQQFGADSTNVEGKRYAVNDKIVYNAKDWDEFYAYVLENQAMYLLQKRLSTKAMDELLELDELPPGIEPFEITELRVTKL